MLSSQIFDLVDKNHDTRSEGACHATQIFGGCRYFGIGLGLRLGLDKFIEHRYGLVPNSNLLYQLSVRAEQRTVIFHSNGALCVWWWFLFMVTWCVVFVLAPNRIDDSNTYWQRPSQHNQVGWTNYVNQLRLKTKRNTVKVKRYPRLCEKAIHLVCSDYTANSMCMQKWRRHIFITFAMPPLNLTRYFLAYRAETFFVYLFQFFPNICLSSL